MASVTFDLKDGLLVGTTPQLECEVREPTAGDIIAASEESEKVVMVALKPELITSPTMMGINTLRRQVVRIGEIAGPLERDMLDKLSADDLNLIQAKAEELEAAARSVSQRGRDDGAGANNAAAH